ncbi:MAG: acyl-CoA dehydrogenase [Alphaproteobacteria bacterium HGW-Alphaproteobacteria-12]|nr:MAG: acyl-CoA dehydrogenase [Alphaproteobacteria bacterium HGW-Alphaproteobacteria-12]
MELAFSAADAIFRDEVRTFLDEKLTPELRAAGRRMTSVYADYETTMTWHRTLYEQGWVAPAWPREHGGCDWSVSEHYIFSSELSAAGAPPLSPMGLGMCGPVLIGYGTPEQKAFYLPRILNGEDFWCQGYSEPGSGSDLASLQMSAVPDGNDFICNGQKIWTTHANYANRIFNLVRTSKEDIPQRGITFILIDMETPGVKVEPLVMLSGEHIQNQIFFTDVRVPKTNVVGKVGEGWTVAKYLMQFERGGHAYAPGLHTRLNRIRRMAGHEADGSGAHLIDDAGFARKLAEAAAEITALEYTEHRIMSALSHGEAPGAESSLLKTRGTEVSQRLTELALEAAAFYVLPFQPHMSAPGGPVPDAPAVSANEPPAGPEHSWPVAAKYLNDRAGSIYAGTNEIQRNIMAKAVLGL